MKTPPRQWSKRLLRRFSPRRLWLGSDGSAAIEGGEGSQTHVVIGRGLCLFMPLDAGKVPAKQRNSFVALAVQRAAPFPDPGYEVAWSGGHAAIWYWSKSRVSRLLDPAPQTVSRFLVEPQLTGTPGTDKIELLALVQGFEGRVWQQGRLSASRWWPQLPEPAEWQAFLRATGFAEDIPPPEPQPAPIASRPWSGQARPALALGDKEAWIGRSLLLVGILGCAAIGFEVGAGIRGITDASRAEKAAKTLDAPLQNILQSRANAEQAVEDIQQLLQLQAPRQQMELLNEVKGLMPADDWQLVQWNLPAPDRLEVTFATNNADPTQLVAAWEASPMFSEVSSEANAGSKRVTIKAKILSPADENADDDQAAEEATP